MAELIRELGRITALGNELMSEAQAATEAVSAEWTGSANAQFRELHALWATGAQAMITASQHITDRAMAANTNYEAAADHSARVWS
ncbi:hypothetical protein AX769_14955 [Frondihabitans sp. PAMC 28766]|nr:hypothetical protein AX769_14955 [Frondihabitans sp. PAMC 28766]